jgi:hypothetical protein
LTPPGGHRLGQWINPAAFALVSDSGYGDAPRNIARGPRLWQADFGLAKRIPLSERMQMQFRSEFFDIFNRPQYGLPLADLSTNTFGQIVSVVNAGPVGTDAAADAVHASIGVLNGTMGGRSFVQDKVS